jgi:hypothetical protein
MRSFRSARLTALIVVIALAAIGATLAATGRADVRKQAAKADARMHATGPVVSLWVIDHQGADPRPADLIPYRAAFRKVMAGCWISPATLASAVFQMSDQATLGSGVEFDNLAVLQAMADALGSTKQSCNDDFVYVEARLEGSVTGD